MRIWQTATDYFCIYEKELINLDWYTFDDYKDDEDDVDTNETNQVVGSNKYIDCYVLYLNDKKPFYLYSDGFNYVSFECIYDMYSIDLPNRVKNKDLYTYKKEFETFTIGDYIVLKTIHNFVPSIGTELLGEDKHTYIIGTFESGDFTIHRTKFYNEYLWINVSYENLRKRNEGIKDELIKRMLHLDRN